jgi:lipopolysaccharide export system permease protein
VVRLLDRYLLRELLVPLCFCLGGFLLLWITSDLFTQLGNLREKQMRAGDIAEYYLIQAPEILALILPIALLLALLYTLTNHARHNEITAMRSAGISLWRLSTPYFAVGLAATALLFVLNEFLVPDSTEAADQVKRRRIQQPGALPRHKVRNLGFTNAREHRIWQIGLYNSLTGEMFNPQVIWAQPDGSRLWIRADRARRINGVWTFYNAHQYQEKAQTNALLIPLAQTNVLALPELSETTDQIKSEIRISNMLGSMSLRGARKADVPILEIMDYLRLHPQPTRSESAWLYTKLNGRLAAPWTCLVVVLMALPFGAASGRRNVFVGVASSILICFIFFVLQQLGLALGTGGYVVPWLSAWFPNITFGLAGLLMTARVR